VLFKSSNKGRHHVNRQGLRHASTQPKQHAKGANDPWLLSTSLKQNQTLARRAIAIYKTRMQIEEGFRDMKCQKTGLGFNASRSLKRIEVLLFLNVIASIVLILIGFTVFMAKQHYQYQANTIKTRRVLSFHFIGLRTCADKRFKLLKRDLTHSLNKINQIIDGVSYAI